MITIAIVAAGILAAVGVVVWSGIQAYRGPRILVCPETARPVGATIDALVAARTELVGKSRIVVTSCSRWPERAGCDQACARQVEGSPGDTLVRSIVARWYRERPCTFCGATIDDLGGAVVPAFRGSDGRLREWREVAPVDLPDLLNEAVAVCARCDAAEAFLDEFSQLITSRPSREGSRRPVLKPSVAVY